MLLLSSGNSHTDSQCHKSVGQHKERPLDGLQRVSRMRLCHNETQTYHDGLARNIVPHDVEITRASESESRNV
jgi:hypothetical protein